MEAQNLESFIMVISARYSPVTSAAVEKLTEEFNVLIINIKAVNEKLEIGYQISGPPAIFKPIQRP